MGPPPAPTPRSKWARIAVVAAVLGLGLAIFFHASLRSGLHQDSPYDCRHLNYVLEWGHRCLSGDPLCSDLWSPPNFAPERGVASLSELLYGLLPFYSPWRWLGLEPGWSFYACGAALLAADFLSAFWLLRRHLGASLGASLLGSWLFAFGAPRANKMDHLQLFAQAPAVLALIGLLSEIEFEPRREGPPWAIPLLFAGLVLQFYSNVYFFWFALFLLALTIAFALAAGAPRAALRRSWTARWPRWLIAAAVASALLAPGLTRYLERAGTVGGESYQRVEAALPDPLAWVDTGPQNWVYGQWYRDRREPALSLAWEKHLGTGFATLAIAAWGLWLARRRPWTPVFACALGIGALVTIRWPGGGSAWLWIYEIVPGAAAIRAPGRISLFVLLGVAAAAAWGWQALRGRSSRLTLGALALLMVVEQGRAFPGRHRVDRFENLPKQVAEAVPDDCEYFYLSSLVPLRTTLTLQVHAMWAVLAGAPPTFNGYASYPPPGWELWAVETPDTLRQGWVREKLQAWIDRHELGDRTICWLRVDLGRGREIRRFEVERLGAGANRLEDPSAQSAGGPPPGHESAALPQGSPAGARPR